MGLVEKLHVIASHHPVDASAEIIEGQFVRINSSGDIVLWDGDQGESEPFGVAGDTKSTTTVGLPGAGNSIVLANSGAVDTVNRVSDPGGGRDETAASGRMTVYHGGGEFATDQFESGVSSATVGDRLWVLDATGKLNNAGGGSSSGVVATLTRAAGAFPSGVPGTDINGDLSLSGDNNNTWIEFKLLI